MIYERITLINATENLKKTALYSILNENPAALVVQEVNHEGDDKSYYNENKVLIETIHVIDKNIIKRRTPMVLDKTYGVLVVKKEKNHE